MDFIPPPPPERPGIAKRLVRGFGQWFLIGILAAAIVGGLSPLLAEQFWICEILCHFQPQYVTVMTGLALFYAIGRRWRMAAMALSAGVITFSVWILPLYWPNGQQSGKPRTLRLLSANLDCHNPSPDGFYALLDNTQPDIVLVFELTRVWAPILKMAERGYKYSHFSPSPGHSGCGIYSKLPLKQAAIESVGPYPNFVVVARVEIEGQPLRIFGTHPLAPYSPEEMQARNEQLAHLAKLVGGNSTKTIIAGDFNTSSWAPCFSELARSAGLRDSRDGFGVLPTFPSRFWPVRTTIDQCLVSPDIEVIDRWVGQPIGSDHLPILIDLRLESSLK